MMGEGGDEEEQEPSIDIEAPVMIKNVSTYEEELGLLNRRNPGSQGILKMKRGHSVI